MLQLTLVLMLATTLTKAFLANGPRYPYNAEGERPNDTILKVLRDLSTSTTEEPDVDQIIDLLPKDMDSTQIMAKLHRGLWWWYQDKTQTRNKRRQNLEGRSLYNHNSFGLRYGK
ncbi:hypothetical protein DPEC_G00195140 [Dallia pectoralis]|uniref:Uncharacterized protein n=1 Tax=Dallia pectoralis TaxID=75939 RepID=A0ACC2G776_DALPE|nr:hypothetical protein DPEC_G00195140 [Dallia pectoralis]